MTEHKTFVAKNKLLLAGTAIWFVLVVGTAAHDWSSPPVWVNDAVAVPIAVQPRMPMALATTVPIARVGDRCAADGLMSDEAGSTDPWTKLRCSEGHYARMTQLEMRQWREDHGIKLPAMGVGHVWHTN